MTDFGKFELFEEVGRGSFGAVHRAHDRVLDRFVAIKLLHSPLAANSYFLENFQREARNSARLEHPNIVVMYETGEIHGRYYQAMRWYSGGNLAGRIQSGPLALADAARIFLQVCAGVQAVHAANWIHRDLKPANILFDANGMAVVSDFGLARALASSLSASSYIGTAGTPFYRAPELWRDQPATPASDVYSLGCILAEMLTGLSPFRAQNPDGVLARHLVDGPDFGPVWPPAGVPLALADVIRKALSREGIERYPDAAVFRQAVEEALLPGAELNRPQKGSPGPAGKQKARSFDERFKKAWFRRLFPVLVGIGVVAAAIFSLSFLPGGNAPASLPTLTQSPATASTAALPGLASTFTPQPILSFTPGSPSATPVPATAASTEPPAVPLFQTGTLQVGTGTPQGALQTPASASISQTTLCENVTGTWNGVITTTSEDGKTFYRKYSGATFNLQQKGCTVTGTAWIDEANTLNTNAALSTLAVEGAVVNGATLRLNMGWIRDTTLGRFYVFAYPNKENYINFTQTDLSIVSNQIAGSKREEIYLNGVKNVYITSISITK